MRSDLYSGNLVTDVLAASPLGLVRLLYRELSSNVRTARLRLRSGDIFGRGAAISKAQLLLGELVNSLDLQAGGQIAVELHRLYDYMMTRLWSAHRDQSDEPLAEVLLIAEALEDAWTRLNEMEEISGENDGRPGCIGVATESGLSLCG